MTLYLGIALLLFGLAFLRLSGAIDARYEKGLALCLTILAFVASVVRWDTGTDWENYTGYFQYLTSLERVSSQTWWGPGYAYPAVLVQTLGGSYSVFLLLIAIILFPAKFVFLTRTSAAPLVAIFVLFCIGFYDIFFVRETVAIVFFWGFVYYYFNNSRSAALICAAAALTFHVSAALPLGITVFFGRFQWRRAVWLTLGGVCLLYIVITYIDYDNTFLMKMVGNYIEGDWIEVKTSSLSTTVRAYIKLSFLVGVIAAGYASFARGRDDEQETDLAWRKFCLRCATGIIMAAALLLPLSEIFARVPNYAAPLLAIVLSGYRFRLRPLSIAGTAYLVILLMLFVQLGFFYSSYADEFYPFKTILY